MRYSKFFIQRTVIVASDVGLARFVKFSLDIWKRVTVEIKKKNFREQKIAEIELERVRDLHRRRGDTLEMIKLD